MRKIREVLRLKADGLSKRQIAASLGISATAAMECLQRARRAGLTWPLPEELDDVLLELRLYPPQATTKEQRPLPNWAVIQRELKRPGVTLELLWQNYRDEYPGGYGYSRFCDLFRVWQKRVSPTMPWRPIPRARRLGFQVCCCEEFTSGRQQIQYFARRK